LIRQFLTESLLLAICGAALGLFFANWGKEMLIAVHENPNVRIDLDLRLDARALAFTAVITGLTTILFGLLPALRSTRVSLTPAIKGAGRTPGSSRSRLGRGLLVVQVAMSVILLVGAGLFVRTAQNLYTMDFGFNTQNLLQFRVNPQLLGYEQPRVREIYEQMVSRIRSVPGVRDVTMSPGPLLSGSSEFGPVFVQGRQALSPGSEPTIHRVSAGPDYFKTLEVPVILGRPLVESDNDSSPKVVVINESLAREQFPNENPIGRRLGLVSARPAEFEIVGVVKDFRHWDLREGITGSVFVPYLQRPLRAMSFKVRTSGDPLAMVPAIRAAVREIDSNLPIFEIKTQIQQLEQTMQREILFARASSFFGALALLLSCIGLYGLMSHNVTRRTKEIGIRLALGARRGEVVKMVMHETLFMVLIGVVAGVAGSIALSRGLSAMLYGLTPNDPLTVMSSIALMLIVTAVAGYIPARRASRVDPIAALRYE
jgi:predicted permease